MDMTFQQYIDNPLGKKSAVFSQREMYKDLYTQKEASIDFNKKCLWRRNTVVNALKKVPGDELFEVLLERSCICIYL